MGDKMKLLPLFSIMLIIPSHRNSIRMCYLRTLAHMILKMQCFIMLLPFPLKFKLTFTFPLCLCFYLFSFSLCVYVCVGKYQVAEVGSVLPSCGCHGWNLGCRFVNRLTHLIISPTPHLLQITLKIF